MNIFELSKYVLVPILSEWLTLYDTVALDTAASHDVRKTLVKLMAESPNTFERNLFPSGSLLSISAQCLEWCVSRQLNLKRPLDAVRASFTKQTVHLVSECKSDLKCIHLLDCSVDDIYDVLQACGNLETLVVVSYHRSSRPVKKLSRYGWKKSLPSRQYALRTLSLNHLQASEQVLIDILVACTSLASLSTDNPVLGIHFYCAVIVRGNKLQTLELSEANDIDGREMDIFCLHGVCYKSLKCCYLTDTALLTFLMYRGGPSMESLDLMPDEVQLHEYSQVWDTSVSQIATWCPNLTYLNLSEAVNLTEVGVLLLRNLPKLTYLNVMNIPNLSTEALHTVCDHCPALKVILLGGLPYNLDITATDLIKLSNSCTLLEDITLIDFDFAVGTVLPVVPYWTNITILDLGGNPKLTDAVYVEIFQTCTKLRAVHMHRSWNVTIKSIQALVANCPEIHTLNIGECERLVNKTGISLLLKSCPLLTYLDLYGSDLNPKALRTIKQFGGNLKRLGLVGCRGVTNEHLYGFASMPRLRVLGTSKASLQDEHFAKMNSMNNKLQFTWFLQSSEWQQLT